MAFDATNMALIADGNNRKVYAYGSEDDAMAAILGAAYFDAFHAQLDVGDLVICQDSGDLVAIARVTASAPSGVTLGYTTGWAQQANIAALTEGPGTADGTIADVGGSFSQATLNNNFKDLSTKVNAILSALDAVGITA